MNTYKYNLNQITIDNAARVLKFNAPVVVGLVMVIVLPFVIGLAIRPGTYMVEAGFGAFIVLVVFMIQRTKKINNLKTQNQVEWDDEQITVHSANGSKYTGKVENIRVVKLTENAVFLYLLDEARKKAPTPIAISFSHAASDEIIAFMQSISTTDS